MVSIGIRELRQHASRYLRRVRAGERIAVTDRGTPVAWLVPVDEPAGIVERLAAAGDYRRAAGSLLDLPVPAAKPAHAPSLAEAVRGLRDEERW